jgi:hypothetical protein
MSYTYALLRENHGYTSDLGKRVRTHAVRPVQSTAYRTPLALIKDRPKGHLVTSHDKLERH